MNQLSSYIAPAAPATRRPVDGELPYLRPEIGFTPAWYRQYLDIDFGERWHTDPVYRKESVLDMRRILNQRFPDTHFGNTDLPLDLLTGTHGACTIAGIYGIPIRYEKQNWPAYESNYFTDEQMSELVPPDLDSNPFFNALLEQVVQIKTMQGSVTGFINWQGILNNAQRLRGQQLFMDMYERPELVKHLFECVYKTMTDAAKRLYKVQADAGFKVSFFTISNCLVNMLSADLYREFVLPFDKRLAEEFGCIGIHNCAWTADPYLESYAEIPNVGYIDMGLHSDLVKSKELFPQARRAIMYTPMDLANKSYQEILADLERIATDYGPCDIVAADIEAGTPDDRILFFINTCKAISKRYN